MNKIIKENGIILGIMILWLFIHFICLMLSNNSAKTEFYPFTDLKLIYSYDITEFVVYGISPFVLFSIIKLIYNEKN
jgi:hypothetical protein